MRHSIGIEGTVAWIRDGQAVTGKTRLTGGGGDFWRSLCAELFSI